MTKYHLHAYTMTHDIREFDFIEEGSEAYGIRYVSRGDWDIIEIVYDTETEYLTQYGIVYQDVINFFKGKIIYRIENDEGYSTSFIEDLKRLLKDIA